MANFKQQEYMRARRSMPSQSCNHAMPAKSFGGTMSPEFCRDTMSQDSNRCDMPKKSNMYAGVDELPLAMAYIPWQKFCTTFELHKALQVGTIFPELEKPFCGKRGVKS